MIEEDEEMMEDDDEEETMDENYLNILIGLTLVLGVFVLLCTCRTRKKRYMVNDPESEITEKKRTECDEQ